MKNNNIKYINNNTINNKRNCKKLCEVIPLFIKILILITITLYLINNFVYNISLYIANIPFYSIKKYQIWRLFSTSLMTTGIINILLYIILWVKFGTILENSMGTLLYLFIFIINSSLIQIIYSILVFLISLIIKSDKILKKKIDNDNGISNGGFWPYIICELTLLSLSNPNEIIKLFFFPEIKTKFYPIIVFIIFCLLNNLIIDLEVFCGILYAFIYHFLIKNKLKISKDFIKKLENSGCIKCFMKCGGFISIGEKNFSSSMSKNYAIKKERSVSINNNLTDFENYGSETNVYAKDTDSNSMDQNKNSLNQTLDIKMQK